MTPLGKPLVFYLKYMAEMNRLYWDPEEGEERDRTGLDDAEHALEMAHIVGGAACEQAADFLALCGKGIEDHFTGLGIATLVKKRSRRYVISHWQWEAGVQVASVSGDVFLQCGVWITAPPEVHVSLAKDVCGVVIPYIFNEYGGRKSTDTLWKILGGWPHSRGAEGLLGYANTVDLDCIPIKPQPPESFDVDRDQLIAEVVKTIARIGAEETKVIANFAASLKGSEEDGAEHEKKVGEGNDN